MSGHEPTFIAAILAAACRTTSRCQLPSHMRTTIETGPFASYTEPMLRYAITDRARAPVEKPAQEGALLRQAATLASLARKLLAALRCRPTAPKLLINSRADVAIAIGADGVHLTSATGSLTPADIRQLYASAGLPEPIVSVSCHTLAEVAAASGPDRDSVANLILFGPVFEKVVAVQEDQNATETLIAEGIGLNLLHLACAAAAPTPVLALGGITPENTPAALAAGAAGVAAIRHFLGRLALAASSPTPDAESYWRRPDRDPAPAKSPAKHRSSARSPVLPAAQPAPPEAETGKEAL